LEEFAPPRIAAQAGKGEVMNKLQLLSAIGLSSLVIGCAVGVKGSGNVTTQSRAVEGFSAIQVRGASDIQVAIAPETSVKVTTDDNLQELVETILRDDTLVIQTNGWLSTRNGVRVDVTVPSLHEVKILGSGDINVRGLEEDAFTVGISGSGDINVSGSATNVDASVSGSGDIRLRDLLAQNMKVRISGSGNATVNATETLVARVSGSGDIRYVDHPGLKADTKVSGSGDVSKTK
jgi:hypothetical protein